MIDSEDILRQLKDCDLTVVDDGVGENLKAQTSYPQYIIYLADTHLYDDKEELSERISSALPEFEIDGIKPVPFRRKNKVAVEVWVFVHKKEQTHNRSM